MAVPTQPDFIPQAWASGTGNYDTIPATQQEAGRASWDGGFPFENTIPVAQGGVPSNYRDFQGVLNALSQFAVFQQAGGVFAYSADIDYPVGALICSSGVIYQCIAENGPGTSAGAKGLNNVSYWMPNAQLSRLVIGRKSFACIYLGNTAISPSVDDGTVSDNAITLGQSNRRWGTVYSGTGSINTSDERKKRDIADFPDAVLDAWGEVDWQQFRFLDSYEAKGERARTHSGLIAQRIAAVFQAHGLDASKYGFFCHDSWDSGDGCEAGDAYALRYDECFAIEAAYQRRRAARLEERIARLEALIDGDMK